MNSVINNISDKQEKSILVVDDDMEYRNMILWNLKEKYVNIDIAENGDSALSLIKEKKFSLILTDLTMPGMNGIVLLEKIKQLQPKMNVIVLTGFGTVESAVYAIKKGAFNFLLKPIDINILHDQVEKALMTNDD